MKKEQSYDNLYKKIDATSKTRFHASRRLKGHAKFSTYSVVLISLALILISLMQAYDLGKNIDSELIGLIQVFSSVSVLVYSLLIDKNDYSNLAEKMYSCAAQLGELKQEIYPLLDKKMDEKNYQNYRVEYNRILKLYETHSTNDFRADYLRAQLDMPEHYPMTWFERKKIQSKVAWGLLLNHLPYITLITILGYVVCWLWFG
ncbi:SLATT domain-containing protein [Vibrio astriarenae]